ncbi:MAG: hypothetical protein RLZZ584_41 [Pseudomonadota bacterium]
MLSSVPGSTRAIAVNIEIMRTFVRVRHLAATHVELAKRLTEFEDKTEALAICHDASAATPATNSSRCSTRCANS